MKKGKTGVPDISGMTMAAIASLVAELHDKAQSQALAPIRKAKSGEWLWRVGAAYHIRTVSYHYTGRFVGFNGPNNSEIVLEDAAWIADDGRFAQAIESGTMSEIEPYPEGSLVGINRTSIVDFTEVKWTPPRSQK